MDHKKNTDLQILHVFFTLFLNHFSLPPKYVHTEGLADWHTDVEIYISITCYVLIAAIYITLNE